ncbi:cytochrome c3 family protein [Shewanella electrodiphila]|uniref:Cytochrome c3 family protein n=1 Tax=Shewanella electrodiphila TaxID=934143 RepID=A0ABT0KSG4_9GAMM|nr:cytochrome c3 family protein [Shewanella electrodiphila]MCL1046544.1 cytochrome c3 family protein [Shewanella electrodiphila]
MKQLLLLIIAIGTISVYSNSVFAKSHPVLGKHQAFEITCADCHKTEKPTRKASQKACRSCHENQKEKKAIAFKDKDGREVTLNIHDSHVGDIRCTVCHSTHTKSKLYCNEACHHAFELQVP